MNEDIAPGAVLASGVLFRSGIVFRRRPASTECPSNRRRDSDGADREFPAKMRRLGHGARQHLGAQTPTTPDQADCD